MYTPYVTVSFIRPALYRQPNRVASHRLLHLLRRHYILEWDCHQDRKIVVEELLAPRVTFPFALDPISFATK